MLSMKLETKFKIFIVDIKIKILTVIILGNERSAAV